jgi:hypothetical protein
MGSISVKPTPAQQFLFPDLQSRNDRFIHDGKPILGRPLTGAAASRTADAFFKEPGPMIGPVIVFSLCSLTSAACALLLFRAYARTKTRLLFWCALCFVLLAINNVLVLDDILTPPLTNLIAYRQLASLGAVAVLIYGFIWEVE